MLCDGDEFLFLLAKPSRSFQNLAPGEKECSYHPFAKCRKNGRKKNENRLTNKTSTPKNDIDYTFSHCENVSKGCNHFLGEKSFCCVFYLI